MRLSRSSQQRASRGLCGARRSGKAARSARARAARRISTSPPCTCRRNTEATSRSTSSGALSRSPRSRARARSPSGPSSPRAVARTLASTTITIGAQGRYRRLQRNRTSRAAARPVKDLLEGRFAGLLDEPGPKVFLEGLVRGSCALTQDGMSLLGYVFDLHARHGAIMALEAPVRKRAVIGILRASVTRGPARRTQIIPVAAPGGYLSNQVGEQIAGTSSWHEACRYWTPIRPADIEWHLGNVFTKLGISSRRELCRALAPPGPADPPA